jgi:ATP-dependent Clp protease ATP-binding subunit ClpC
MFETFSHEAREAIARAEQEARQMGHAAVHVEHLLLGLLSDHGSVVDQVFADFAVTIDPVRVLVRERLGLYSSSPTVGQLTFSPDAKDVLRSAYRFGMGEPRPEHLLLAILGRGQASACEILRDVGTDPDRIRFATKKLARPSNAMRQDAEPGGSVRHVVVEAIDELDFS